MDYGDGTFGVAGIERRFGSGLMGRLAERYEVIDAQGRVSAVHPGARLGSIEIQGLPRGVTALGGTAFKVEGVRQNAESDDLTRLLLALPDDILLMSEEEQSLSLELTNVTRKLTDVTSELGRREEESAAATSALRRKADDLRRQARVAEERCRKLSQAATEKEREYQDTCRELEAASGRLAELADREAAGQEKVTLALQSLLLAGRKLAAAKEEEEKADKRLKFTQGRERTLGDEIRKHKDEIRKLEDEKRTAVASRQADIEDEVTRHRANLEASVAALAEADACLADVAERLRDDTVRLGAEQSAAEDGLRECERLLGDRRREVSEAEAERSRLQDECTVLGYGPWLASAPVSAWLGKLLVRVRSTSDPRQRKGKPTAAGPGHEVAPMQVWWVCFPHCRQAGKEDRGGKDRPALVVAVLGEDVLLAYMTSDGGRWRTRAATSCGTDRMRGWTGAPSWCPASCCGRRKTP